MARIASNIDTDISVKDDALTVHRQQDCTPIAEYCKSMQNEGYHGTGELKFAGKIPEVMVEKYCNDNHITFREFIQNKEHVRRVMNDPAMSHFRIWKGDIGAAH
jgi:hypothetical protein